MKARRLVNASLYYLSSVVPRARRRVMFGAWHGHRYSDNTRSLFEHLRGRNDELDLVWCGSDRVRQFVPADGGRFVRNGSLRAMWEMARAHTVFVTHGYTDIAPFNLTCRARIVYLGHGIAIKKMGTPPTAPPASRLRELLLQIWRNAAGHSHYVASSPTHRRKLLKEYANQGARSANTLILGQPRCDALFGAAAHLAGQAQRRHLSRQHGVPEDKIIVTYMPTFRDTPGRGFSFRATPPTLSDELSSILQRHNAVLIERSHFVDGVLRGPDAGVAGRGIIDLSQAEDVDSLELLLATDLLITDYSGAYVDFLLLDRPVLHFAYDLDEYANSDRGLYFHLSDVAGGPVINDLESLLASLDLHLEHPGLDRDRRTTVRHELLAAEQGRSSEAVAEHFFPFVHG